MVSTSLTSISTLYPYYDWTRNQYVTLGSRTAGLDYIQADSSYITQLPRINESDTLNWQIWATRVNPGTSSVNPDEAGFFWWNPETQRYERTQNYTDYESAFSPSLLNQTWRVNASAFNPSEYGDPFTSFLTPYTPTVSNPNDFIPYYTQGRYAQAVAPYVYDASEWQALFDEQNTVVLRGLGVAITQYGTGVTVVENPDGTLSIVSNAGGGIASSRLNIDPDLYIYIQELPLIEFYETFLSSQRLTPIRSLEIAEEEGGPQKRPASLEKVPSEVQEAVEFVNNPSNLNANVLKDFQTILQDFFENQDNSFPQTNNNEASSEQDILNGLGVSNASRSLNEAFNGGNQNLIQPLNASFLGNSATKIGSNPILVLEENPEFENFLDNQTVAEDVFRVNTSVLGYRQTAPVQAERRSVNEDASWQSEERKKELRQNQAFNLESRNASEGDLQRQQAQQNSPQIRMLKALQLKALFEI